jgi:hypothetical protein
MVADVRHTKFIPEAGKTNSQFENNLCTWFRYMAIRQLKELVTAFLRLSGHNYRKRIDS